ncbi:MAG: hypothetical protein EBR82_15025 [Caulobacteraceae bacterium]|nr:hypothetical protein [Caulobacteraceae bacterium]
MKVCDFNNPTQTCQTCGYYAKRLPTYRECRPVPKKVWRPIAVGDAVEQMLTSVGITKERVEQWTRTSGKSGGCGCASRQRWLNELGFKVQWWVRRQLEKTRDFYYPP